MGNTDLAGKAAFYGVIVCWWLFALTFWLRKRPPRAREAKRDLKSYFGLLLQAVGYFIVWVGPLRRGRSSPGDSHDAEDGHLRERRSRDKYF